MFILAIGDIIGRPGRLAVQKVLPALRQKYGINLVVANVENVAGGIGVTPNTADELLEAGVDVMTSGNHIWAQRDIIPYLDNREKPILRPLNYPPGVAGRGWLVTDKAVVINLIGRTFMNNYDCPFRTMDALLEELGRKTPVIIVDFHAEATSEKVALGRYLDGRVSAVLGTHTHVGTIDIGSVLQRFLTMIPSRLSVGQGKVAFNAILIEVDSKSGKATKMDRVSQEVEE